MKAKTTIGFRLDTEFTAEAEARARKLGLSVHELAYKIFVEWLTGRDGGKVAAAMRKLHEELSKLRSDLREATVALLCDAGKVESRDDAQDWVNTTLFK